MCVHTVMMAVYWVLCTGASTKDRVGGQPCSAKTGANGVAHERLATFLRRQGGGSTAAAACCNTVRAST